MLNRLNNCSRKFLNTATLLEGHHQRWRDYKLPRDISLSNENRLSK